jgi:alcohol dehydrogenase
VPTTAGTGSEAQSYALSSDADTHVKMAIGDDKAAFAVAILDPEITLTQPFSVRAAAGYDAISHAVESLVTTKRNAVSECFSREAWRRMNANFETILSRPDDVEALAEMQLGAWFAGCAIEASMLGATHALANPLTAVYGVPHGQAIAVMLPHVVRWNAQGVYKDFHSSLPDRLRELAAAAQLKSRLSQLGVAENRLTDMAAAAAQQWTGRFNPRPFGAEAALELYQCAF